MPQRTRWLLVVAAATLLGSSVALVEPLRPLDEPFLDLHLALRGQGYAEGTPVAIVHVDARTIDALGPWPWPPETLDRALRGIAAAGPRVVVLAFSPPPGYANPLVDGPRLLWPARFERTPQAERAFRAVEGAGARAPEAAPFVFPADPVVRRLPVFAAGSGTSLERTLLGAALAAATEDLSPAGDGAAEGRPALARLGDGRDLPLEATALGPALRVNWVGEGLTSFGALSLAHVLDGHLGDALAGKVVVLGPSDPGVDPGVVTPTSRQLPMPRLEVLAHALDTALREGRALARVPAWAVVVAVAALTLAHGLFVRQARPRLGGLATLAALAAWFAAGGVLLRAGIVAPYLPLALALGAVYVGLSVLGASEADDHLRRLALELGRLDRRIDLGDDEAPEARFHRALELCALFIEVDSLLLFRARAEDHRLELLATLRASEEDVAERRRDSQRSPWKEAQDPTRRVVRPALMRADRKVSSLLAPLLLGNRLAGILVVNRPHDAVDGFAADERLIRFIAQQLATLVYRDELDRPHERPRFAALSGLLRHDRFGRRVAGVERAARSLLEQKDLLQSSFAAADAGIAVADLFGRVLFYNERLGEILERGGVALAGRNLVELIEGLAGLERAEVIRRFTRVVMGEPFELLLAPQGEGGAAYRFSLGAIRRRGGPLLGLVASFSDVTALRELDRMKTNLLDMVSFRVLNMLSGIQGYAELLAESRGLDEDERGFARALLDETRSLASVFDAVSAMARLDLAKDGLKLRPLDLVQVIRERFADLDRDLDREVTLELAAPERFDVIAADREMLGEAFAQVLRFAVDSAERRSALSVSITEEERYLRIDIKNRGFGMPAEAARQLFGSGDGKAPLARAREVFEVHGGAVKSDAQIGEGLRLHLWLPLFMKGGSRA